MGFDRSLAALALALACALRTEASGAAPRCDATVYIEVPGGDPVNENVTTDSACTLAEQSGPAFLISDGGADWGALHARSEATYLDGETDQAYSFVKVEWRDTITVDSPGLTGQVGTVHASAHLDGFIDLTGSAYGTLRMSVASGFGLSDLKFVQCSGGSPVCDGTPFPRVFSETVPVAWTVRFGEPGLFALQLTTNVDRNPISTAPGTADLDFGSTATWSGIQQVTVGGTPVPFTVAAESGTDWMEPVPEPAHGLLLLTGAAVLVLAGRRPPRS